MTLRQADLDALSAGIEVVVEVLDDRAGSGVDAAALGACGATAFLMQVRLTNGAGIPLPASGWELHLPSTRRLLQLTGPFELTHATGDHCVVRPQGWSRDLLSGESVEFLLVGEGALLNRHQLLPRWYLSADPLTARVIDCTDDEDLRFVAPLPVEPSPTLAAGTADRSGPADDLASDDGGPRAAGASDVQSRIIPKALQTSIVDGNLDVRQGLALVACPDAVGAETRQWWRDRARLLNVDLDLNGRAGIPLRIEIDESSMTAAEMDGGAGGYRLVAGPSGVQIAAVDAAGAGHAVMTLFALLPAAGEPLLPLVDITDAPRYPYRAFMLDIARNYQPLPVLQGLVDQFAAYKLNVFHLHLSDDEGWRLEIPGLPELTEVGARRGHTGDESDRLLAQLGSGPDGSDSSDGHLTREDYVTLVRYAAARGVEVVPEIDVPGHCRAAVVAMESRCRRLRAAGAPESVAAEYRLIDPDDGSQLLTVQLYDRRSSLNPAVAGTAAFLQKVIAEVAAMHADAGVALRTWHAGGDEVSNILLGPGFADVHDPRPHHGLVDQREQNRPWELSPQAHAAVQQRGLGDVSALPAVLLEAVDDALAANGIPGLHLWQDGADSLTDAEELRAVVVAEVWVPLWMGATAALATCQAKGFPTVFAIPDCLYFDAPNTAAPDERGATWATRALTVPDVFCTTPDNPPQLAAGGRRYVAPPTAAANDGAPVTLQPMYGLQACLWTEFHRTRTQVERAIFPRLLAAAERAWHRADWELDFRPGVTFGPGGEGGADLAAQSADLDDFLGVLESRELPKLRAAGIAYWAG